MNIATYSSRVVMGIVLVFLLVLGLGWAGIYAVRLNRPTGPVVSGMVITIDPSGKVIQDGKTVGRAVPVGDSEKIRLEMASNASLGDMFTSTVDLPGDSSEVTGSFASIQGNAQMTVYPNGPSKVIIDVATLLPESHSVVTLTAPAGYFAIPFWIRAIIALGTIPVVSLEIGAILLILLTLAYVALVTRKFRPTAKGVSDRVPENLAPIEIAVLARGELAPDDISSLVYGLAEAGWLQIIQKEDDVLFYRQQGAGTLMPYEDAVLGILTRGNGQPKPLSEVVTGLNRRLFSRVVGAIYYDIYARLLAKGYVSEDLPQIHLRFKTAGIILQLYAVIVVTCCYFLGGAELAGYMYLGLAGYVAGFLLYRSGYRIVPLTLNGQVALNMYAQLDAYFNQPDPMPLDAGGMRRFYSLLPYALVGGSTEQWLRRFDHEALLIPAWFTSEEGYFYPMDFLANIHHVGGTFANLFAKVKDPNVD